MKSSDRWERISDAIAELSHQPLDKAAFHLAQAGRLGRNIHVFGLDARAADIEGELFFRAGGLANVDPIYDPALSNSHGAYRSELLKSMNGLAPTVLQYYESIESGNPLVLIAFDENAITLSQAIYWAKERELVVITLTPAKPQDEEVSKLIDISILVGSEFPTVVMTAALGAIMDEAVRMAPNAPTWKGEFYPDVAENALLIDEFLWRIRHL